MTSPNPEADENKKNATTSQTPAEKDITEAARITVIVSHGKGVNAEICAHQTEARAHNKCHWNWHTIWQGLTTLFTGLAFGAAAVYAHYAELQLSLNADAFHFANRAYLGVGIPDDSDWTNGNVFVQIMNTGHLPASNIAITVYSARESYPFKTSSGVCRVSLHNKIGISPSVALRLPIPLPNWQVGEGDSIKSQKEAIFAGMEISYNDGFSTPEPVQWCSQTKAINQKVGWTLCPDGELDWLKAATANQPACQ